MIPTLAAFPILVALLIFQSAVINRFPLLNGSPDLVLLAISAWALQKRVKNAFHWTIIGALLVGLMSALPFGSVFIGYFITVAIALLFRKRVWQMPILAMFFTIFVGTFLCLLIDFISLRIVGVALPINITFNQTILPSLLLNLVLAAPFYVIFSDLAGLLYPMELEM
jgi:rod shape-determining protein MreD